ncbi:hypothetical protein [Saccharibacillus sacchari]|uniref:Uncharacterized protein n=1 Tax=Saccharibacillus sacchari TaxID=456493 RepID=A0ACC6PH26_9BACL
MKTSTLILSLAFTAATIGSSAAAALPAQAASNGIQAPTQVAAQSANRLEVAGIDDPKEFHEFFFNLQQAVAKNDKKTVASMMNYPLNVNTNGKTYKFRTSARFIAKYDSIMTPEIKRTLAYALEDELFANWKGVMLGDGQMWFGVLDGKLSVYAINK